MLKSVVKAAKELGVSVEHIRRMLRAKRWPFYRLGPKATRVDVEEVKRLEKEEPRAEKASQQQKFGGQNGLKK